MNPAQHRAFIAQMLTDLHTAFNVPMPSDAELQGKIKVWSTALTDVPCERIPELSSHLIREHGAAFMPTAGEAFVAWEKLSGAPPRGAANAAAYLPFDPKRDKKFEALPDVANGPGRGACLALMERLRAGKGNVACKCGLPAELSEAAEIWRCKENKCNFSWPATDAMNAPHTGAPGPLGMNLVESAPEPLSVPRPANKGANEIQRAAALCELDLSAMEPLQLAHFSGFVKWWNRKYDCALSRDYLSDYFPVWLAEHQEREKEIENATQTR